MTAASAAGRRVSVDLKCCGDERDMQAMTDITPNSTYPNSVHLLVVS